MARKPATKGAAPSARTVVSYDMATGERTERPYTPEEDAEADRMKAAWEGRVPPSAMPHQIRVALVRAKKLEAAEKAAAKAGGETQVMWEYGVVVERHGVVGKMLNALLGDAAADQLFRDAQEIR